MNVMKNLLCLLLGLAIALCFCGCDNNRIQLDLDPYVDPDAIALYKAACEDILAAEHLKLNIISEKTVKTSRNRFSESYVQSLSYANWGKDSMRAHSTAIHSSGISRIQVEEFYDAGTLYTSVNDNHFCGAMPPQDYISRYLPAVLLSPENYRTVRANTTAGGTVLIFADATVAELWADVDADSLISAWGEIKLDSRGGLTECTYSLHYASGETDIQQRFTAHYFSIRSEDVKQITSPQIYLPVDSPHVPIQLEIAAGLLAQTSSVSSFIQEIGVSEATDMHHEFTTQLQMQDESNGLHASVSYESKLIDYSRDGETSLSHQFEEFADGVYSYKDSGDTLQQDTSISTETMRQHLLSLLLQNIAMPSHILSVSSRATDNTVVLEFILDAEMEQHLKSYVCEVLTIDASLLDSLADAYQTDYAQSTLILDATTGLPVELTIRYKGEHTIEGQAYQLTYDLKQTFQFDIAF